MLKIIRILLIVALFWVAISLFIQGFMCPDMTQTEIMLNLPNAVITDFKKC